MISNFKKHLLPEEIESKVKYYFQKDSYRSVDVFVKNHVEAKKLIFDRTNHITGISNRLSQRIFHFANNLEEIPKDELGIHLGFHSIKKGYLKINPLFKQDKSLITDVGFIESFIRRSKESVIHSIKKYKNLSDGVINLTPFLPTITPIKTRIAYIKAQVKDARHCKVCEKLLHKNIENEFCSFGCKNSFVEDTSKENIIKFIKDNFFDIDYTKKYLVFICKRNKKIKKVLFDSTKHIDFSHLIEKQHNNILQRIFHLCYDLDKVPRCGHCGNIIEFNNNVVLYPATCSVKCNNKYSKHIESRLKNSQSHVNGYKTNIGRNEDKILEEIEKEFSLKYERNKPFGKYIPDAIDYENKVIIEINEPYHFCKKKFEYDIDKYHFYESKGFGIVICWDNIEIEKHQEKLNVLKQTFHSLKMFYYFQKQDFEILSENGWKSFLGVKFFGEKKTITIITDKNKKITVTKDHILYSNNIEMKSELFKIGDLVTTIDGEEKIISITDIDKNTEVCDIVQVDKNHNFFSNGFLVHNCLICDEFARIQPNLMTEFWTSVYPVVSSALGTKVFLVSTPNGTGNIFYEIYERASLGIDKEGWVPFKMHWSEVPGHDEKWKQVQLASFNFDEKKFAQEFDNCFLGSSYTLIPADIQKSLKQKSVENPKAKVERFITEKNKVTGKDELTPYSFNCWETPILTETYMIGADVGDGVGSDFSVILVFKISYGKHIELVASYSNNLISTTEFSYILYKMSKMYNSAFIACERNGIGKGVIDNCVKQWDYDNFIRYKDGTGKTDYGIVSHNSIKTKACLWARDVMSFNEINVVLNDQNIIFQLEWFERKVPSVLTIFSAVTGKHDDYVMALVWALLVLKPEIIENYYIVEKYFLTERGMPFPERIRPVTTGFYSESFGGTEDYEDQFLQDYQEPTKNRKPEPKKPVSRDERLLNKGQEYPGISVVPLDDLSNKSQEELEEYIASIDETQLERMSWN